LEPLPDDPTRTPTPNIGADSSETYSTPLTDTVTPFWLSQPDLNRVLEQESEFENPLVDIRYTSKYFKETKRRSNDPHYQIQKTAVEQFLIALETCSGPQHTFTQKWKESGYSAVEAKSFSEACRQLRNALLLPRSHQRICNEICAAYTANSYDLFFHIFSERHPYESEGMDVNFNIIGEKVMHERQELLSGFDKAFDVPYRRHALSAFIEFLDLQWLNMKDDFKQRGTPHSPCATIVQSSCTGKSRLVKMFTPS
jgi:hypothetical protein